MAGANGRGEPEVVRAKDLAPEIRRWVIRHIAEYPAQTAKQPWMLEAFNGNPPQPPGPGGSLEDKKKFVRFAGPWEVLSQESGVNTRRLSGIANEEDWITHVSLSQADDICRAMDIEYKLDNGEIPVIPNPNWSAEKWHAYMEERGCA